MDPKFSPVFIAVLFVAVAAMMAVAIFVEQMRRRRDRVDGVLMSWDDLRLTASHLIVGSGSDALRLPLDGLKAEVVVSTPPRQAESDGEVRMTIHNAGHEIRRLQPYSYGSSGSAQAFAIKFNSLSAQLREASEATSDAAPRRADRHAA
ncbi:hypothetical protein H7J93_01600 [Mycobacterium barrassiae]|uniref:hypothetical protein n=1 Tax=Mycobacterium barrassiae TaxID=319709 RepID=UPI002265DE9E|nr:hypothetical protein [Mycobacterium barrassiae]MCV7298330.1 hypothetical protein [Mycobacterium barrassiae]